MSKIKKTNKELIDIYTKSYIFSKREIKDAENGYFYRRREQINNSRYIVNKIEGAVECLSAKSKFIITKEVLENKIGKWYLDFFSSPTYYRNRNQAYKDFLLEIEKK